MAGLEEAISKEDSNRILMKMLNSKELLSYQKRPPRMRIKKERRQLNMRRRTILNLVRISNSLRPIIKVLVELMISMTLISEP